jgi:hypothetical protein
MDFVDGTTWDASQTSRCIVTPSPYLEVDTQ